jgi:hypothetical protein
MRNEVKSGASVGYRGWIIVDTPCYPCRYKVYHPGFEQDNATWRYHRTTVDARQCIDRHVDNEELTLRNEAKRNGGSVQ